jgi:tetratricopeptide (TPR) repeat protein
MKPIFFLMFLVFLARVSFGQNTDDENIKKVISTETRAHIIHDADAWQNAWLHSDKISSTYTSYNQNITETGWDQFGLNTMEFLKTAPDKTLIDYKTDSFNIVSNEFMAWVSFKQILKVADKDSNKAYLTYESRVLVKQYNEWKIQCRISCNLITFADVKKLSAADQTVDSSTSMAIDTSMSINNDTISLSPVPLNDVGNSLTTTGYNLIETDRIKDAIEVFKLNIKLNPKTWSTYYDSGVIKSISPQYIEGNLNTAGYDLMAANRFKDAIDVLKLNVTLFPKSWNTFDSLGEAYAAAGNRDKAIENYKMSLKLNPKNDGAIKALVKLKAQFFVPH